MLIPGCRTFRPPRHMAPPAALFNRPLHSDRNRVRVFLIKTLVDRLEIAAPEDESVSLWDLTHTHCGSIDKHFRSQVRDLIGQRFSATNELAVLNGFVDKLPIHVVSAKT